MTQLVSIACRPAENVILPADMKHFMQRFVHDHNALRKYNFMVADNSIQTKYSVLKDFASNCIRPELFVANETEQPDTEKRMLVYRKHALPLLLQVALDAINKSAIGSEKITDIITVSCTGLYAPGLETELLESLNLSADVNRFGVNFMGCYAAFHAFRLAKLIAVQNPEAVVLIASVELCTLHFRNDTSDDNILSTYLFGDGAAACLMAGKNVKTKSLAEMLNYQSSLVVEGKKDMQWLIGNHGFEMVLSNKISKHIQFSIKQIFEEFLAKNGMNSSTETDFCIHPGGKNILKAFESAIGLRSDQLKASYDVLRDYGNMSSVSIFFVLEKILEEKSQKPIYAVAFGPGLTLEQTLFQRN